MEESAAVILMSEELEDDETLLLLMAIQEDTHSGYKHKEYPPFDLQALSEEECKTAFRFSKQDIINLSQSLKVPQEFTCGTGIGRLRSNAIEGICILLRRLAYPCRLCDLVPIFGRCETALSDIFNYILDHVYDNYTPVLTSFNQGWLHLSQFTRAIHQKGAPLNNCFGFIDGTVRAMCRPGIDQASVYNGHKRVHAIKFQGITTPNGLIANLAGPYEGRRHDSFLLHESDTLASLSQLRGDQGEEVCVYGDAAYPLNDHLITPFPTTHITPQQEEFNKEMNKSRQIVEWSFGKVINLFAFLDYKKNLKLYLQPVAKYYMVGVILTNCHTCLYGSQISDYFDVEPPTVDEYLAIVNNVP